MREYSQGCLIGALFLFAFRLGAGQDIGDALFAAVVGAGVAILLGFLVVEIASVVRYQKARRQEKS